MTQKEIDVLWKIIYTAKYHPNLKDVPTDELAKWISKQLHESLGLCTYPVGSNYFYLGDEAGYKAYHESAD
jgi:hypothetical protein